MFTTLVIDLFLNPLLLCVLMLYCWFMLSSLYTQASDSFWYTFQTHTHTHTLTKKVANLDMYSILSGEVFFYENSDISDDDGWGSWTTVSTHRSTNTTTHPWWSTSPLCTFLLGSQERYRAWNWTSWNNWSRSAQNLLPPLTKLWKKTGVSGLLGLVAWKTNDD